MIICTLMLLGNFGWEKRANKFYSVNSKVKVSEVKIAAIIVHVDLALAISSFGDSITDVCFLLSNAKSHGKNISNRRTVLQQQKKTTTAK